MSKLTLDLNERGNTLLWGEDGAVVGWLDLPDGGVLEVALTPNNYPALNVRTLLDADRLHLAEHIKQLLSEGWVPSKLYHAKVD